MLNFTVKKFLLGFKNIFVKKNVPLNFPSVWSLESKMKNDIFEVVYLTVLTGSLGVGVAGELGAKSIKK